MHRSRTPLPAHHAAEGLEPRTLLTMVFLLNGNGYAQATPSTQTQIAAVDLARRGYVPIQVSYASMTGTGPNAANLSRNSLVA